MSALISLITINYNHLKGLEKTFESVVSQSDRSEIEWVIVDGNSTDGSADWLRQRAQEFQVLSIESDKGIYDAMNKGLKLATGDYVWFLNSGDSLHSKDVLKDVCRTLRETKVDVVFGDTMFVDSTGMELGLISKLKPQTLPLHLDRNSFRFGMNLCHQSFIARKSLCPMYNITYKQAADVNWVIDVLKHNPSNVRTNFVIANFEVGGSSYQHTQKAWKERYTVLQNQYGFVPNLMAHAWIFIRRILFNIQRNFAK